MISQGSQATVEIGRVVSIQCVITSVNGGDTATWYRLDDRNEQIAGKRNVCNDDIIITSLLILAVENLENFITNALVPVPGGLEGQKVLNSNVELDDFRTLFSSPENSVSDTRQNLISYVNGIFTISTSEQIVGRYVCQGNNQFGLRNATINVVIQQGQLGTKCVAIMEPFSVFRICLLSIFYLHYIVPTTQNNMLTVFIRVSYHDDLIKVIDEEYQLAVFESRVGEFKSQ